MPENSQRFRCSKTTPARPGRTPQFPGYYARPRATPDCWGSFPMPLDNSSIPAPKAATSKSPLDPEISARSTRPRTPLSGFLLTLSPRDRRQEDRTGLGYLHQRLLETRRGSDYHQYFTILDRINYKSPLSPCNLLAPTVEKLLAAN